MQQILNAAGAEALSTFLYTLDDRGNRTDAAETLVTPSGGLMGILGTAGSPATTPTPTPDLTVTPAMSPTGTSASAPTATSTPAPTATETQTPTATSTPTETSTALPTETPTLTPTETPTATPSETPTLTVTPTGTPTMSPTGTPIPTPTATTTPLVEPMSSLAQLAAEGNHSWHYQYDNLSRVTYACSDWMGTACAPTGHEFHYTYDGAGNLTRFDKWNATTNTVDTVRYVINGANQITCVDADTSGTCNGSETVWQYDKFGNLLSDGTSTYVYDAANRLSSVIVASGTTTYAYSGDGDRIAQTVNSVTTTYVLDTATPLTMVLSETTGTTTIRYWQGLDLIAQSDGIATTYLNYDGLGSVRQLTDPAGSVQLAQTFDPYGTLYSDAGTNSTRYAFTGEYQDANGLLYLRARYYNAGSGRFTQMDPSRLERNAYQYSYSNPILFTDPSGLFPPECYSDYKPSYCYGMGLMPEAEGLIPRVNESTGELLWKDDMYGEKHNSRIWLSPSYRRNLAARLAREWSQKSLGELTAAGYYISPDENGDGKPDNCFDCARFASYISWRAGFRMEPDQPAKINSAGIPYYTVYEHGWWANIAAGAANSAIWDQVTKFREYWKSRGAQLLPPEQLQEGDIVIYDFANDGPEVPDDHVAVVVKAGGKSQWEEDLKNQAGRGIPKNPTLGILQVASRGNGECGVGVKQTPYDSLDEIPWDMVKIEGLHMPYELP